MTDERIIRSLQEKRDIELIFQLKIWQKNTKKPTVFVGFLLDFFDFLSFSIRINAFCVWRMAVSFLPRFRRSIRLVVFRTRMPA